MPVENIGIGEGVAVRQEQPALAGGAVAPVGDAGTRRHRPERFAVRELARQRRVPAEQGGEYGLGLGVGVLGQQEARAQRSVVEAELVHPAPLQQVVRGAPAFRKGRVRPALGALEGLDAGEVRVDQARPQPRRRLPRAQAGRQRRTARRVDQEAGLDDALARPEPNRTAARVARNRDHLDRRLFPAVHALLPGTLEQEAIDVGAQPLVVRRVVVGRGGDDQPPAARRPGREGLARFVLVEAEAPLESTAHLRQPAAPAAVGGEVPEVVEAVAHRQPLEGEVGERRRRLAERKPRMAAPLQQQHVPAFGMKRPRQDRTGEAPAGNHDLAPLDVIPVSPPLSVRRPSGRHSARSADLRTLSHSHHTPSAAANRSGSSPGSPRPGHPGTIRNSPRPDRGPTGRPAPSGKPRQRPAAPPPDTPCDAGLPAREEDAAAKRRLLPGSAPGTPPTASG